MGRYDIDVYGEGGGSSTTGKLFLFGLAIFGAGFFIKEYLLPWIMRLRSSVPSEAKRGVADVKKYGWRYLSILAFIPLFVLLLASGLNEAIASILVSTCILALFLFYLYKNS